MTVTAEHVLQVRKAGPGLWVVTSRGEDSTWQGPDRFGDHSGSFKTRADALAAALWRKEHGLADRVEWGPAW